MDVSLPNVESSMQEKNSPGERKKKYQWIVKSPVQSSPVLEGRIVNNPSVCLLRLLFCPVRFNSVFKADKTSTNFQSGEDSEESNNPYRQTNDDPVCVLRVETGLL